MKKENIYKYFDIPKDANKEEIKEAYRKKAKQSHPDSKISNREDFEKATRYYKILLNSGIRRKYDETGSEDVDLDKNKHLYLLSCLFQSYLDSGRIDFKRDDVIDIIKTDIKDRKIPRLIVEIGNCRSFIRVCEEKIKKLELLKRRIIYRGENNIFENIINSNIENTETEGIKANEEKISLAEEEKAAWEKVLKILKDYDIRILFEEMSEKEKYMEENRKFIEENNKNYFKIVG